MTQRVRRRHSFAFRLLTFVGISALALVSLSACGGLRPYTTISPRTKSADEIQFLYKVIFWLGLVVFVGVQAGVVYAALRFRRRRDEDARPAQIHGNKTLEIVWTIIPAIVLLVIFVPTVSTLYKFDEEASSGDYTVEVYGKQWWWEVHYTEPKDVQGVITANEIHVPTGKHIQFKLMSNNVIHSFWVPQLAGKMDVMPGHINKLGFTVDKPGTYWGECAEYCGDSHAWMRFKIIAEPQEQFDNWIAAWKSGPSQESAAISGDVSKVPAAMGVCITCHRVEGTNMNVAAIGLEEDAGTGNSPGTAKIAGPNLTLFGCRTTIGAGILENTPENLALWLHDPGAIKQGNYMSVVIKKGTLTDDQIDQAVAYLESLVPEGGCTPDPPVGGVATPEAT
ncbi:MAG TPA: cytochrome c oxidase subunit II [Thermomicrobiales bacterium]|nr:cytochrome c oxidase subunit II [Thermomicrobiales bacterium]